MSKANSNSKQKLSPNSKQKDQLKLVCQVSKQKISLYPYYPVSCQYQSQDNILIFSVQYPHNIACLTFIMIKKDYSKKNGITSIQLAGINDRSPIAVIQVLDFKYKQSNFGVMGYQGTLMLGYREGHLVIMKFKDKRTDVIHKFNKYTKKQSLMSRTTAFFTSQQPYSLLIRGPIKQAKYCSQRKYKLSYLVGNTLIMQKSTDQACSVQLQKMIKQQEIKQKLVNQSIIILRYQDKQICSYNYSSSQQIFLSLSMQSLILCYNSTDLSLQYSISISMPIRRMNLFEFRNSNQNINSKIQQYLIIMPYEDYLLIIDLNKNMFSKLNGHRCFIANAVIYQNSKKQSILLSAGMDHRICFDKVQLIQKWYPLQQQKHQHNNPHTYTHIKYQVQDQLGVQFSNKYSLGQYQNARTNNHDFGFGDLLMVANVMALPTYDGKIKVFSIHYN